ncbi:hypothetical protein KJ644_01305 [Candidatus Dependentiae bacterium]|nr:hypothetical protein [Candidatus Dependentiae bacterium]MBU4387088.1 hypothetical protein [Candidatus Dependentiae bacterium]MCG2756239.1 hypothetical protein [Candidatus Dependentiae bacterium]
MDSSDYETSSEYSSEEETTPHFLNEVTGDNQSPVRRHRIFGRNENEFEILFNNADQEDEFNAPEILPTLDDIEQRLNELRTGDGFNFQNRDIRNEVERLINQRERIVRENNRREREIRPIENLFENELFDLNGPIREDEAQEILGRQIDGPAFEFESDEDKR